MLCVQNFGGGRLGMRGKYIGRIGAFLSWPKYEVGMDFGDLRFFNLAMLAKHGWRLLHDRSSLLFQCFKARYFPRCNFLDAVELPNCSHAWKSMVTGLPILKSGCCW